MPELLLPAAPLAGLAFLLLVGAGPTVLLAPRLPPDALAALAPVAGAALIACASVLVPLDVPARPLAVSVAVLGVGLGAAARRRVVGFLRAGALPLAVAVAALAVAGIPGFARGDWHAATLYGSTDAYHWSSQARAYLDGPAPAPATEHPDRVSFERSRSQHWAVAVPFGLLQLGWLSDSDPASAYGALAALLATLLPLATFAVARACLGWRPLAAAAAALALAANAALLFAHAFSWQQQVAGTAFAFAAAAALRLGVEPDGTAGERLLAAVFAAAALASYRLGFAPYLLALLAGVAAAHALAAGARAASLRRLAGFTGAFALLAAPSLVALARGLPGFVSSGGFDTAFKRSFPGGQLGEALGLVPNVWGVEESWPVALRYAWLGVAWLVAVALLVAGARALRGGRRADFVALGAGLTVAGYALLALPVFAPYLSFKILSYGAPFLVLVALAPFARRQGLVPLAAGALLVPSAAVASVAAARHSEPPGASEELAQAVTVSPGAFVEIAVDDPWQQAWALYYLRDRRLSVAQPSYLLTEQGLSRDPDAYRHRPVAAVVRERDGRLVVARP